MRTPRLVTLQPMMRLMLDAIAQREMQLNEVMMERKKIPLTMKHLRMLPMPEIIRMKRMMKPMLQLTQKRL